MEKHKIIISDILIFAFLAYTSYYFAESNLFEISKLTEETEFTKKFINPFAVLFVGGETSNPGSFRVYDIVNRFNLFISLFTYGILIIGIFRYYKSKRKKISVLLFMLTAHFAYIISGFIINPLSSILTKGYATEPTSIFYVKMITLVLGLFFIIKTLLSLQKQEEKEQLSFDVPLTWMRGFHSITDRIVLIFLGANMSLMMYFQSTYGNAHFSGFDLDPSELRDKGILLLEVGSFLSYLFTEWLFNISPAKILTGTKVVATNTNNGDIQFKHIIVRTLVRVIPIDFLTFLGYQGWHDKFSNTTLTYHLNEPWINRQNRLLKVASYFLISICIWFIIALIFQNLLGFYDTHAMYISVLPLILVILLLPMMMILVSMWVASISSYIETVIYKELSNNSMVFVKALLLWIPFLHFILSSDILNSIISNLEFAEKHGLNVTSDTLSRTQTASESFKKQLIISYSLIILSSIILYFAERTITQSIAMICIASGIIWLCASINSYVYAINCFSNEYKQSN
jgi:hypothetical protein